MNADITMPSPGPAPVRSRGREASPDRRPADDVVGTSRVPITGELVAMADRVSRVYARRGVEPDDLQQVARLALLKAAARYRPGAGGGFEAYAVPTIHGEIKRYFRDHTWFVRPPRALGELGTRIRAAEERLAQETGGSPSREALADAVGVEASAIPAARRALAGYRGMPLDHLDTAGAVGGTTDPYDAVDTRLSLGAAMARLKPRDRLILHLRFTEELTQTQIGEQVGLSQVQVSRVLRSATTRLRALLS